MNKYIVSLAVDGRVNVEVEAETPEQAMELACDGGATFESGDIEVIDYKAVNAYDVVTHELTDAQ